MIDSFGRRITYLRLSVVDRCDLRCLYCMSERPQFLPKRDVLSLEELERLAGAFIRLGVRRLRLTGGEPLVRRGIVDLLERLGGQVAAGALDELTLTTNGTQLARYADAISAAGVRRINVSLDTLDPDIFQRITRLGELRPVLDGIAAAKRAGMAVKINTVALRGINDHALDELVAWCGREGHDMTLIEAMPLGEFASWMAPHALPLDEVQNRLAQRWTFIPSDYRTGGPARYVTVAETSRRLGFITPMSHNFCGSCNRVRVSCTGSFFLCLGNERSVDLRGPLRSSEGDEAVEAAILAAIRGKPEGHDFAVGDPHKPVIARGMNCTGG